LDAGVGTGQNFEFYPQGANVVGIDFSPAMLARARRRMRLAAATVELKVMDLPASIFQPIRSTAP
jgi:ubiquinone/menaquinone biosynthesis C-methylase UbiE